MFKLLIVSALVALAAGAPGTLPRLDGRIVGGKPTTIEEFPYQLSLQSYGYHICGASIISSTHAITAAHCTDFGDVLELNLRAGTSYKGKGGKEITIKRIFQNPKYNRINIDYDITVLEFDSPINFDSTMQPVDLPEMNQNIASGSNAVCTGWGALTAGGGSPSQLQVVSVPIVSNADCNNAYDGSITERMICAGLLGVGGKDACQGDSGGPLVVNGQLVGVVSWGYGCGEPDYPGVYASVPNMRDFVHEKAGI